MVCLVFGTQADELLTSFRPSAAHSDFATVSEVEFSASLLELREFLISPQKVNRSLDSISRSLQFLRQPLIYQAAASKLLPQDR